MKRRISIALVSGMSLTMTALATSAQPSIDAAGHWEGTINTPAQALVVVVDIARQENGTWIGTISVPSQGLKGFALSPMNVDGNTAAFGMKGIPGDPMFKGTITAEPRTIAGDFTQGGATMPFTLAWKGEPKIEPPPKSPPISKELEGSWHGTLNVQGNTLRLVLDLATEAGSGRATLTSLDQNNAKIPVAQVVQTAAKITLLVTAIGASYEGVATNGAIEGTWSQSGQKFPLVFKRASK
jgi:hypothetical protein